MKQRLIWLDVLRGVLLVLITLGHFEPYDNFLAPSLKPTAMYYVPLFFLISGYMVNPQKYSWKRYVLKKTETLLVPFVFFVVLFTIVDWNLYLNPKEIIQNNLMGLLCGGGFLSLLLFGLFPVYMSHRCSPFALSKEYGTGCTWRS